MIEFSRITGLVAAPVDRVWEILTDFAHPQRLAKSIEQCEVEGEGVGAIRLVRARGLTIHERLEALDPADYRFCYRVLDHGDMPAEGIRSYLATVTLRPRAHDLTEIEWRAEGDIDGPGESIEAHLNLLYKRAIDNIRAETERGDLDLIGDEGGHGAS